MSMATKSIDGLFEKLSLTYGAAWGRKWEGLPIGDVKSLWAHELASYNNNSDAVEWALENLPEACPNVIEFRNLCRKAPTVELPRLPEPKANPERIKAEVAKFFEVKAAVKSASVAVNDGRDWARKIIARSNAGETLNRCTLRFAKEALGISKT